MRGIYDEFQLIPVKYPVVAGWEGSGIVIQNGGGLAGWRALGKRVSFKVNPTDKNFSNFGGSHQ